MIFYYILLIINMFRTYDHHQGVSNNSNKKIQ